MDATIHHRIETPLPLPPVYGLVRIAGWCHVEGASRPPDLKLSFGSTELTDLHRSARPDVSQALEATAGNGLWGFELIGSLPPGAHRGTLLASPAGKGRWQALQEITVVVLTNGLQASIEHPPEEIVRESVRLQGWCAHPECALRDVSLHYGNRAIPGEYGLPRSDVPAFVPGSPDAHHAGFVSVKNLPAGRGNLCIVATDTHGARHLARTDRFIDIDRDEENPRGLALPPQLARVGPTRRPTPTPPPAASASPSEQLRLLFVLYGDLTSNSAIHVAALANAMVAAGHECVVTVPENADTVRYHRGARFRALNFAEVPADGRVFESDRPPDVIHAWTTRENVRRFCEPLRAATGAPLFVHLEDHELRILELTLGRSLAELQAMPAAALDAIVPETLSHPRHSRAFLASADGVTLIVDRLRELVPAGPPVHMFWPAADPAAFHPRPIPWDLREALGWGRDHTVLFYHGNVHPSNRDEVRELYRAVADLNAAGDAATLLRTGRDFCEFLDADDAARCTPHVIAVGRIKHHHHLAPLMALADVFVQPGQADAFNDYRFPSKLPEFFALGRPVILPATNLGRSVRHGIDAWVLEKADAAGIAAAVRTLRADPALRERLAAGAAAFAAEHFSWPRSAAGLLSFYSRCCSTRETSQG